MILALLCLPRAVGVGEQVGTNPTSLDHYLELMCAFWLPGGVPGVRSQGLHSRQPPAGRAAATAALRLGGGASHVSAQLPVLHRRYCLHTSHHLQHNLWHGYLSGCHHYGHPR